MFQLHAFSESEDEAGSYAAKAAVADQLVTTTSDLLYIPPKLNKLIGAYAAIGGTVEGAAYLQSPSLKRVLLYDIQPTQEGTKPAGDESFRLHPEYPIVLDEYEGMEAYVKSNPGSAEVHSVVVFLADGAIARLPEGAKVYSVKFTTSITETVSEWKNGSITFRQTLPVGRYAIVGAAMWGTSGVAFRFNIPGVAYRPGFITHSSEGNHGSPYQRMGGLGKWAEFHSLTPPSVDWLAMATSGTSQGGIMDVVQVGG